MVLMPPRPSVMVLRLPRMGRIFDGPTYEWAIEFQFKGSSVSGTPQSTVIPENLSFLKTYSAARADPRRTTRATVSVVGPGGKIATVASGACRDARLTMPSRSVARGIMMVVCNPTTVAGGGRRWPEMLRFLRQMGF